MKALESPQMVIFKEMYEAEYIIFVSAHIGREKSCMQLFSHFLPRDGQDIGLNHSLMSANLFALLKTKLATLI